MYACHRAHPTLRMEIRIGFRPSLLVRLGCFYYPMRTSLKQPYTLMKKAAVFLAGMLFLAPVVSLAATTDTSIQPDALRYQILMLQIELLEQKISDLNIRVIALENAQHIAVPESTQQSQINQISDLQNKRASLSSQLANAKAFYAQRSDCPQSSGPGNGYFDPDPSQPNNSCVSLYKNVTSIASAIAAIDAKLKVLNTLSGA